MMALKVAVYLIVVAVSVTATLYDSKGTFCCNPPKTFEGKIERILDFNDNDGDGIMSPKGDCSVSAYEWVSVWSCRYGDTPDKAFEIFNSFTGGAPMRFEAMRATAVNSTRAEFENMVRGFYPEMAQTGAQGR